MARTPATASGPAPPIVSGEALATTAAGAGDHESWTISAVAMGEAEFGALGVSSGVGVSPGVGEGEDETVGVAVGGGGGTGFGVATGVAFLRALAGR